MTRTWKARTSWLGVLGLAVIIGGCGGAAPQPEPEPQVEQTRDEEAERAAREAEARRREEEARRREEEARRRAEAERRRVLTVLAERVHFDFDKSDIRPDAEAVLQRKVTVLREYPDITLRIEGHADERGSNEYNLALGQRRAEAVRRYLMSYGLDASRFTTISYGEERPLVAAHNEEAWAQNRRAEFVVTNYGRLGSGR
jgi:peptidoglycan-associated lipoprotein